MASYMSAGLPAAHDGASLDDQIRQLELEGSILRSQVDEILSDVTQRPPQPPPPPDTPTFYDSSSRPHSRAGRSRDQSRSPYRGNQRSSSVDAILAGPGGAGSRPSDYHHLADSSAEQHELDTMSSKLDAQAAAATNLQQRLHYTSSASPLHHSGYYQPHHQQQSARLSRTEVLLPPASAERELRESREQAEHLRRELRSAHDRQLREKAELRAQLDGLRARLMEANGQRESLANQRAREAAAQDDLIGRLQASVEALQAANREQEAALLETNRRLDTAKRRQFGLEAALADVRGVLADVETRRRGGRPFVEGEPVSQQEDGVLATTLERCLQEFSAEIEDRLRDIGSLEHELSESRRSFLAEKSELEAAWQRRCSESADQYEAELRKLRDRSAEEQRRLELVAEDARREAEQLRSKADSRSSRVAELESTLSRLIDDYDRDRKAWESKRSALESGLDSTQTELAESKRLREEAIKESALIEPRLKSAEAEVEELKAERDELSEARDSAETELHEVKTKLTAKSTEVAELRALIEALKEESDSLTKEQVTKALAEEQQYTQAQSRSLATQLAAETERCELQAKELQAVKADVTALERRLADQSEERLEIEERLSASNEELRHLTERLRQRDEEVARLAAERDRQYEQEAGRAQQLASVLEDYRHLVSLFEDRSGQLAALESRGRLGVAELERAAAERDSLYLELKDSRLEVAALRADSEAARVASGREAEALRKRAAELAARLKDTRAELALARDALKAKEEAEEATAAAARRHQAAPSASAASAAAKKQQRRQQQLQERRLMALEADNERLVAELDTWARQCKEATNSARQAEAANRRLRAQLAACQQVLRQQLPQQQPQAPPQPRRKPPPVDEGKSNGGAGADDIRAALADIQSLLGRRPADKEAVGDDEVGDSAGEGNGDADADGQIKGKAGDNRLQGRRRGTAGGCEADRALSPTSRRLLRGLDDKRGTSQQ
ncbi:hypothetical protein BOX15_Mlig010429g3 [Macrostomum lignano]|uniref:Uncharacterized protein n=1 Tax=Macrostomum lignano TaxID=282301 RepID=A0A267GHU0_9PLAT|nr:hypothetical protein BOX15_Mlig010429g3 [Macrostomum lignano]